MIYIIETWSRRSVLRVEYGREAIKSFGGYFFRWNLLKIFITARSSGKSLSCPKWKPHLKLSKPHGRSQWLNEHHDVVMFETLIFIFKFVWYVRVCIYRDIRQGT